MNTNITSSGGTIRMVGVASAALLLILGVTGVFNSIAHASVSEPVISAVSATPFDTSATIIWNTDEVANSQVNYGPTASYGNSTVLDSADVMSHSENIGGLTPNTTYHYDVVSIDENGSTTTSVDNTFTTGVSTTPTLTLSMYSGAAGSVVTVNGSDFSPSEVVTLLFGQASTSITADTNGSFSTVLTVPSVATGDLTITATGGTGDMANNTFNVTSSTATDPVLSAIVATPTDTSATIAWNTDEVANSQIMYGLTTNYGNSTSLDPTLVTSHSETISGLAPNTTYHYEVVSANGNGGVTMSADNTFTTTNTDASTTDITTLQNEVSQLQSVVSTLQAQVASLMANQGSTTVSGLGGASIDQNGQTLMAGSNIDFGGHNFVREENISVTMNGNAVATAHADGGGNFSTGSLILPTTPGIYTYTFTGSSGDSANATITTTQ